MGAELFGCAKLYGAVPGAQALVRGRPAGRHAGRARTRPHRGHGLPRRRPPGSRPGTAWTSSPSGCAGRGADGVEVFDLRDFDSQEEDEAARTYEMFQHEEDGAIKVLMRP